MTKKKNIWDLKISGSIREGGQGAVNVGAVLGWGALYYIMTLQEAMF